MYELTPPQYHKVGPFFPEEAPGYTFICALLEGNHRGRVYANSETNPSALLVALACDYNYVAGQPEDAISSRALYDQIVKLRPQGDDYVIVFPTSPLWEHALTAMFSDAAELIHVARAEFTFDAAAYANLHANWRARVPNGFTIQRYNSSLATGQELVEFWGSLDAFLERGFGFAVMHEGEAISRCHTVMVGHGAAEISIETAEGYRGQGLATLAACAFIDHCRATGHTPAWSCWNENLASRNLAESLGFVHHGNTPALVIRPD